MDIQTKTLRQSHIFERQAEDWYVEPEWCSARLFAEEVFEGELWDPACGMGRIVDSARKAGLDAWGSDIINRRGDRGSETRDFLNDFRSNIANIATNPPFDLASKFALHALGMAKRKVAIIFPTARLNAAHWIAGTPLRRMWLMTPRPSMPPGHTILAGEKPGGGKMDYCWLVWEIGYAGNPELCWLRRDVIKDVGST